ncbi:FAD-binding oxidoreductase [Chloroflexota bacterium]
MSARLLAIDEGVISALKAIVGAKYVIDKPFQLVGYHIPSSSYPLTDAKTGRSLGPDDLAKVLVRPANANEISQILQLANRVGFPLRVRGGGTNVLGIIPRSDEVILDVGRLKRMNIQPDDYYVEIGPAVTPLELRRALWPHGFEWLNFPGSYRTSHIGGCISVNTSGHGVDALVNKPGDWVLGLEVVLPSGEIIHTGSKAMRKPAGPDLTRLFVGGEGLFGVITLIRLRLRPKLPETLMGVAVFTTVHDAARAVQQIFWSRAPYPIWLELLDERFAAMGFKAAGLGDPEGACLQIVADGATSGEASWKLERILEACRCVNPKQARVISDEAERTALIRARELPMKVLRKVYLGPPLDPPLSQLPAVIGAIYDLHQKITTIDPKQVDLMVFGHMGGITVHAAASVPRNVDAETHWRLVTEWRELVIKEISLKYECGWGEQGIFPAHVSWFRGHYGETTLKLIGGMKAVFDPSNILNPLNL